MPAGTTAMWCATACCCVARTWWVSWQWPQWPCPGPGPGPGPRANRHGRSCLAPRPPGIHASARRIRPLLPPVCVARSCWWLLCCRCASACWVTRPSFTSRPSWRTSASRSPKCGHDLPEVRTRERSPAAHSPRLPQQCAPWLKLCLCRTWRSRLPPSQVTTLPAGLNPRKPPPFRLLPHSSSHLCRAWQRRAGPFCKHQRHPVGPGVAFGWRHHGCGHVRAVHRGGRGEGAGWPERPGAHRLSSGRVWPAVRTRAVMRPVRVGTCALHTNPQTSQPANQP
jgi:hypothetical protein